MSIILSAFLYYTITIPTLKLFIKVLLAVKSRQDFSYFKIIISNIDIKYQKPEINGKIW